MVTVINYTAPPAAPDLNIVKISVTLLLRMLDNMLHDQARIRWTLQERLDYLNDAAREIVIRRPAARAVTEMIQLAAGTYQQSSMGTSQVLDVTRNIAASGVSGSAIRITERQQLDAADPDWHLTTAGATRHYMLDERSPTTFYVYPPAIDGALVEVLVAKPPPAVALEADSVDMRQEFVGALINWAMYRCHTKDSEYSQGSVASLHYQAFTDAIGTPAQAAQVNSANGNSA